MPPLGWASGGGTAWQANPAKAINYFEQFAHQLHSARRPTLFSFLCPGATTTAIHGSLLSLFLSPSLTLPLSHVHVCSEIPWSSLSLYWFLYPSNSPVFSQCPCVQTCVHENIYISWKLPSARYHETWMWKPCFRVYKVISKDCLSALTIIRCSSLNV